MGLPLLLATTLRPDVRTLALPVVDKVPSTVKRIFVSLPSPLRTVTQHAAWTNDGKVPSSIATLV